MMTNYFAIIKDSSPYYFYNGDGSVLLEISRKFIFPKDLFTVKNPIRKEIFTFEVRNSLFSVKKNILSQNFKEPVVLKEKNKLTVNKSTISIIENSKIFNKYKSSIMLDDQIIGEINEERIFPYKKYLISFRKYDEINYYGIILFAINSVYFADGV